MRKNPSLKKCGYEHHVQMINDTEYSLELNGTKETIGVNLDKSVFSVVKSFNMDLGKHDFVDISLTFDAKVSNESTKKTTTRISIINFYMHNTDPSPSNYASL